MVMFQPSLQWEKSTTIGLSHLRCYFPSSVALIPAYEKKCKDYFLLMDTPEHMWPTAASLHMDNAEKWMHMHKQKHGLGNWDQFMAAVQQKFGVCEYKHAVDDTLELKQTDTIEEYVVTFESLQ
jgi:hypothetical protein